MSRPLSLCFLLPALLAAPTLAQNVDLNTAEPKDGATRFKIATKLTVTQTRKTLVDGEEQTGRGGRGGGGGGETTITQKIVFDQGPAGQDWRRYVEIESTDEQQGPDGEPRTSKVAGALAGKKVRLETDEEGNLQLIEEVAEGDAKPLDASFSRGVPGRVSLAGFLAAKKVEVGEEFELSETFRQTLSGLVHPVVPDRGGDAAGRGQGGNRAGGDRGGNQAGGRRGGGQGRGGRGGGAGSSMIALLGNENLACTATGKVLAIEEKDGRELAKVELHGKLIGKGTAEELGLAGRGGRGGRAGGGDAGASKGSVAIDVTGIAWFDVAQKRITAVELSGKVHAASETKRTMNRGGEDSEIETTTETNGTFDLDVACEAAKGS